MKKTAIVLIILCSIYSCKKDNYQGVQSSINIEGFDTRDLSGNPLMHVVIADSDWQFVSALSAEEMTLFDFGNDINYDNTFLPDSIWATLLAFPNPVKGEQEYGIYSSDSVVLKVVVVNDRLEKLKTMSFKFKSELSFVVDLSDRTQFRKDLFIEFIIAFLQKIIQTLKLALGI